MASCELFQRIKYYRILDITISIVIIIRGSSKKEIHTKKEFGNTYKEPELMSTYSLRYSIKISYVLVDMDILSK